MEQIFHFYQYTIFFYSAVITFGYVSLAILGYFNINNKKSIYTEIEDNLLNSFPEEAPGISVVTPAYNEDLIIIDSAHSLLNLNYPNFEVIIVNDGSTDDTLETLIKEFELETIPYPYIEKIRSQPVRHIFKSTNPRYSNLTIVDKENGGTKADAMNAGVNIAKFDYFINTDIDGLLDPNTLAKMIVPVLDSETHVIAVGATLRMVNACEVDKGSITRVRPPNHMIPIFQETEYLRSYLIGKMGWSTLNMIPNVSGGFGLFDKNVVIGAGGFDPLSHAEDMDMTLRMIAYMHHSKKKYLIRQIPDTCCWTEGPSNLRLLYRQRTRWGRGLLQIFFVHRRYLFNPKYGRMGIILLPYSLLFDLLAPILTVTGLFMLIYLLLNNQVNFETFWLLLFFVYMIGVSMSLVAITSDLANKKLYKNYSEYGKLILYSLFEVIAYQPFNTIFYVIGYGQFLSNREFKWTSMTRQGYTRNIEEESSN
ncbi:glycosyltransferase family 2 protein [Arenibacter latericius]|uniref:glycosyltransferase family 2 protein n=1 Tax=Arenibacter latericius TaxID=86104 RepID=UPI00041B9BF0|nr:glycosyltransferase [Arenibacter latericius]